MAIIPLTENESLATAFTRHESREPGTLLTVHEVAQFLKVPVSWVYDRTRRRGRERLPYIKVGKYLRFRLSDLEAYLETLRRA
jgi:excisionase family DNA binding protein